MASTGQLCSHIRHGASKDGMAETFAPASLDIHPTHGVQ
jgi:hypothetical protein